MSVSKNITITEEAYERLKASKRADESFTDVILRLTRAEKDVWAGFGAWADAELAATFAENRRRYQRDWEGRDAVSR